MQICVHDVLWKVLPRITLRCVFLTSPVSSSIKSSIRMYQIYWNVAKHQSVQCEFMMISASISIWNIHSSTGYWTFTSRFRTKRGGSVSRDTWATWVAMRDIVPLGDMWWVMKDASDVSCVSWLRWGGELVITSDHQWWDMFRRIGWPWREWWTMDSWDEIRWNAARLGICFVHRVTV